MKLGPNLLRAAMVGALATGGALIATTAQAAPVSAETLCLTRAAAVHPKLDTLPAGGDARASALNNAVIKMRQAGMADAKIDATLAADYGMTVTGTKPVADREVTTRATTSGNLTVKAPKIYKDSCTRKYSVFAYWDWNSIPKLKEDAPSGCDKCAVGTVDVMGIALNRDVEDPGGYSASAWGATSVFRSAAMNIGETNNKGFAMEAQDRFCTSAYCATDDYNMYHGQLVMSIDDPGCGNLTAHAKYGHSRASAVLNGVSIAPNSVGISWSSNTYAWNKAGAGASNTVKPC